MIRVLIVDDDKLARKGLISIMPWKAHDMEVAGEAANGVKALEFLNSNKVDLLFVDLSMPVMSGMELIRKSQRLYPSVRFVVITFHQDFKYVQAALRLGAIDYISKIEFEEYESSDFDSFLSHLQQIMKRIDRREGEVRAVNVEKTAVRDKVERDWKGLHWLYNDFEFERLCSRSAEGGIPASEIERIFAQTATLTDNTFHTDLAPWPVLPTRAWISGYRKKVYSYALQAKGAENIGVCILKTIAYLRRNLSLPLHAESVAERVGMSRSYFCQCFKKLTGLTYNEYVRSARVEAAKDLLRESSKSVKSIAEEVGYGDEKYFSRIFREETGSLPSEYRGREK